MRMIALVFLLSVSVPVFATDAQRVVGYECRNIDANKYGFRCAIESGSMHLHWTRDMRHDPKETADRSKYTFKKMYLRYFSVGGKVLTITGDHWPVGAAMLCSPTPSRQGKICQQCKGKDKDGNYANCDL